MYDRFWSKHREHHAEQNKILSSCIENGDMTKRNPYISDVAKLKLGRGMISKDPCDKMTSK